MKFVFLLVLVSFLTATHSVSFNDLINDEWNAFKSTYSKLYLNKVEEQFRMKVYLINRKMIAKHNRNPKASFKLKMNKFGDLTPQEFEFRMTGFRMEQTKNKTSNGQKITFLAPQNFKAPSKVDWRQFGLVTPVKDQKECGACWAFSATGSLEGQHMRKTGQLVSLSEQNLIDCSHPEGNLGCNGGTMDDAFQYVIDSKGIDTEQSYPYEARDDVCRFSRNSVGATDIGMINIPRGNEQALLDAVASVGPISVAIDHNHDSFKFYHSGVHYNPNCSSIKLDHGVLVVGYGTENGVDYWLVKNSWGEDFGANGYIRMARNANNNCGIATQASYPVV